MAPMTVFPWDGRDQLEQAQALHDSPLRNRNRQVEEENLQLKKLLRANGISWMPLTTAAAASSVSGKSKASKMVAVKWKALDVDDVNPPAREIKTRSAAKRGTSTASNELERKLPHLPMEVQLRILQYAMTSRFPIIDPLVRTTPGNLTAREKKRGNQIAIHFLATCKSFYAEGHRSLWRNNEFLFTTVHALRNFASLDVSFRRQMHHVTLRIIAKFYDDETRTHKLGRGYHPDLKKDVPLKVAIRLREQTLSRKGFRCYTWAQTIDFLNALRPPYDPQHDNTTPRPRLLPDLETMRIDFVNFPEYFLPFSDNDLHEVAAHDLGCTLNELRVTGLPCCEVGIKAGTELSGMVKNDGLFLDGVPAFVDQISGLKPLSASPYAAKVVRSWLQLQIDTDASIDAHHRHYHHGHGLVDMPVAPADPGHPMASGSRRKTIWKRVPVNRDTEERDWMEFDRRSGVPVDDLIEKFHDSDDDDDGDDSDQDVYLCSKCGEVHGSFDSDDF